jgi:muconate cycloisomerase
MTGKDGRVRQLETVIVDLPLLRPHKLSRATITTQSYLYVRVLTEGGCIGWGEATVPGGPWWGGESVETMKIMIDTHCAPHIIGRDAFQSASIMASLDRAVFGNRVAKAAIEVALLDAAGRMLDTPISTFFGGRQREDIPVLWALGTGEAEADVAEARAQVESGRHTMFKIKVGFSSPQDDLRRVAKTAEQIGYPCSIDPNEAWDLPTASHLLPMLEGSGIVMIEQPIARTNLAGMAALSARLDIPLMADEAACSPEDVVAIARARGAEAVSLKISKAGGLRKTAAIAAVAQANGIACFGGTALDSSIGVAASLQLYSTLPELRWGCELFAPLLLKDEIVVRTIRYSDGAAWVPEGPGTGVEVDSDKLAHYARKH